MFSKHISMESILIQIFKSHSVSIFGLLTTSSCVSQPTITNSFMIWASTRENLSSVVWEQHWRRPACASAQSDKRHCFSLFGKYNMWTCYRWNVNFLASLCSWGDLFETRFVGNPEDRFSRDETHLSPFKAKGNMASLTVRPIWNVL